MAHKIVKLQAFSAIILLGLLAIPFLVLPSGTTQPPAQFDIAGDDRESPRSATGGDLDADYLQSYLVSVLDRVYNFSRETDTGHGLNGTYYHVMKKDWSATVDGTKDKYSYDSILTYFGLWAMQLGSLNPEVVGMFDSNVRDTSLYTRFNGTTGAFRANMSQDGMNLNDTYRLDDNALALLCLLQFAGSGSNVPLAANDLSKYLWNYLNNSLWHSDSDFRYNYFLDTNATIQTEAMSFLNLLGALVCSMVARNDAGTLTDPIKTQAADLAQRAFSALNYSDVFAEIGGTPTGDYCFKRKVGEGDRLLTVNALGVATLADFYLRSGRAEANRSALIQAEKLYGVINRRFYDESLGGYVLQVSDGGVKVSQTSLEGNAYWLFALSRLFEASGNITYYEKAVEVYQQVVANLWDGIYLGFNQSTGDPTKSVGKNALFYLALQEIDQAYRKTTLTITNPKPELVILANPILNLTCQYNLTWAPNGYTINQPVAAANITLNLYLENGTFIDFIEEIIDYTNVYGNRTILHALPTALPLGDYVIYAHANRTGFGVAYATSYFSIVSNMSRTAIDPIIRVVQGESTVFNITIDNKRNNDTLVSCSGTGTDLTIGAPSFLLANHTVMNRTIQITAGLDAPLGIQEVTLKLVNNSISIFETEVIIEVLPAVSFQYCEFSRTIVAGIEGQVFIVLQNARPKTQENVNVTLRSDNLQAYTQSISLQPNERVKIYVPLNYTGTSITGMVNFEVNVSRHSQIVQSAIYTSKLASAIEIQSVSTSTIVLQGRSYFLNLRAVNNVNDTQQVDLYINDQLAKEGIALVPGQNDLVLPMNPLTYNPWDLTTYTLNVTLKAGPESVFQNRLFVQSVPSIENILFFWVLPLVLPVACLLIFLQRQKKREMLR